MIFVGLSWSKSWRYYWIYESEALCFITSFNIKFPSEDYLLKAMDLIIKSYSYDAAILS